jgi:predicted lipid-binding transport protein (Tim44 family)
MKLKKIAVVFLTGAFLFGGMAAEVAPIAYAARGGARISVPKMAPKAAPAPSTKAAPSGAAKVGPNQKEYTPSKSAKELSPTAPGAKAAAKTSGTGWGNALRNVGLFAGGMMLGSMLGHLFGWGMGGLMSDIMGLFMNGLMLGCLFVAARWLWRRFRGSNGGYQQKNDYQAATYRDVPRHPVTDIKPPADGSDYSKAGMRDYEAKSTADRYRKE